MNLLEIIRGLSSPLQIQPTGLEPKLKPLRVKAVAWDVYGTLLQSGAGEIGLHLRDPKESSIRETFEAVGFKIYDDKANLASIFNDTISAHRDIRHGDNVTFPEVNILQVWEDFLGELEAFDIIREEASPIQIKVLATQYEFRSNPVWPMPGLLETLSGIVARNLCMSTISNAQFFTPLIFPALLGQNMESLGFIKEACVWSFEILRAKPSMSLFETSAEYYEQTKGLKTEEVLYIGNDMLNDIKPASHIGFKTALFAGDARSLRLRKKNHIGVEPDIILTELPQVLSCIL